MTAPDKTNAFVNPISPKRRSITEVTATTVEGSAVALIDPLVHVGVWAAGSDASEKTELKVGFIPLTDCASVTVASALGLDREYGIKITSPRETSWTDVRDKFVSGDLDAVHVLYGLIYGMQLGTGGPKKDIVASMTPNNSGQAITLSSKLKGAGVKDGASLKAVMTKDKRKYVFAQIFPIGTHTIWLYYWLTAHGIHPLQDVKAIAIPSPQMVANMRVGNMDGYCVGEPWGARAIADNTGFTAEITQAIWKDHPGKVLGTTTEFVQKYPNAVCAPAAAMLKASKFIGTSALNRRKTAEITAVRSYVSTDMGIILDRMLGRYTNGLGKTWDDPDPVRLYHDGAVSFPYLLGGMWFLTQHKRWNLLKAYPGYLTMTKQVNRVDIFKQAATATGTPPPKSGIHTAKLADGMVRDAKNPAAYADGFKLKA